MKLPDEDSGVFREGVVSDVMAKMVIAVRPEDTVRLAIKRVIDEKIGAVPVLDEDGRPVGILTHLDLLHAAVLDLELKAEELMSGHVQAIHRDGTLAMASATMAEHRVHRLIVVDDEYRAVGMVSSIDVVQWLAEEAGFILEK